MKKLILSLMIGGCALIGTSAYAAQQTAQNISWLQQLYDWWNNTDLTKVSDTLEGIDNASAHCPADKQEVIDSSWVPEKMREFFRWACGAYYKHGGAESTSSTTRSGSQYGGDDDPFGQ
jgi:hypothetical protein